MAAAVGTSYSGILPIRIRGHAHPIRTHSPRGLLLRGSGCGTRSRDTGLRCRTFHRRARREEFHRRGRGHACRQVRIQADRCPDDLRRSDRSHVWRQRCPLLQYWRRAGAQASRVGAGASKEQLVARLRETFRFCETALSKVNDSRLGGMVPYFSIEVSQAAAMVAVAEEWAGHYSQIAVYLRLNGLLPPTARPKPA